MQVVIHSRYPIFDPGVYPCILGTPCWSLTLHRHGYKHIYHRYIWFKANFNPTDTSDSKPVLMIAALNCLSCSPISKLAQTLMTQEKLNSPKPMPSLNICFINFKALSMWPLWTCIISNTWHASSMLSHLAWAFKHYLKHLAHILNAITLGIGINKAIAHIEIRI